MCSTTPILPRRTRHEEPASFSGKSRIICGERMGRFVRPFFGHHSGKLCMRQKESGAVKVHTLVAPRSGNGSDRKGISVL